MKGKRMSNRTRLGRWRVRFAAAVVLGGTALAVAGSPAGAQPAGGLDDLDRERFAFDAADSDGDGVINEAEMTRDAAVGFATLDKDGSGTLTAAELAPHDAALFAKVDGNGDGSLTFEEVMTNKVRAITAGDKDRDGGLSFEEMVEIVEVEGGAAS
jgi:Ca2+-binding EF-hand superfamily protein